MRDISAIVYASNTGFTRRYAEMLSRAAAIPAYDLGNPACLPEDGARIFYFGWLCAGGVTGLPKANKRWDVQAVFAVGLSPDNDPKVVAKNNGVKCPLFYAQGGYAPVKLKGINKLLMSVITGVIAKTEAKKAKTDQEREQLAVIKTGCDFVDEANLAPALSWLREEEP